MHLIPTQNRRDFVWVFVLLLRFVHTQEQQSTIVLTEGHRHWRWLSAYGYAPQCRSKCRQKAHSQRCAGNGLAIIAGLQITPCGITVGIDDGINYSTQYSSGVSILLAAGNIAYIVKGLVKLLSNCLTGFTINKLLK